MIRPILKALLAATALMPVAAMAQDGGHHDRGDRGGAREGRSADGDARPQRPERAPQQAQPQRAQPQAPQAQAQQAPAAQFQRREGRPDFARQRAETGQERPQLRQQQNVEAFRQRDQGDRQDGRQGFRRGGRDADRADQAQAVRDAAVTQQAVRGDRRDADQSRGRQDYRQDRRNDGAAARNRIEQQRYGRNDWQNRDGNRDRFDNRGNWNRGWRNDNRYDYDRYRSSNRNVFHLPRYYAPYGWSSGYRRFSIGFSLNSILFGENYWIDDPWYYRLPPAEGPYRWVRYYNDALLVDLETGEVVDTVYDIFW